MKSTPSLLYVLLVSILSFSCEEKRPESKIAEKISGQSHEESESNSTNSDNWLMKLMEKEPMTEAGYLALVPETLQGYPLQQKEPKPGMNGFVAFYSHQEGSEYPGLRLEVIDGAGNHHFQHVNAVFKMLKADRSEAGDDFKSEIKTHKGHRVLLVSKTRTDRSDFQLEYIQNQRYHVGILGNRVEAKEVYGAFDELESDHFPH